MLGFGNPLAGVNLMGNNPPKMHFPVIQQVLPVKATHNSMPQTKVKKEEKTGGRPRTLQEAHTRIEELEAELTGVGAELPKRPAIKTLDIARSHIAKLESLLPQPEPEPEPEAQLAAKTPSPIEPSGMITALKKPVSKPVAEAVKKVVAANAPGLPTMEALEKRLDAAKESGARAELLESAAGDYKAAIKAESNYAKQTELFRSLHRIQRRHAHELFADPEALKAFNQRIREQQIPAL
jgi:hypothetical protein